MISVVIFLAIVSVLWAVLSLKKITGKKKVKKVHKQLKKEHIIFQRGHSSS